MHPYEFKNQQVMKETLQHKIKTFLVFVTWPLSLHTSPTEWNALWFLWLWIQEERRVLLIIRGIFLIPRSDKGLEWQPKPVITVMNCETVPLFDSSDTCSRVSSACISRLVPKIISYVPNDFDVIWWCFDKLIGTPFVHHLQKSEPACVGKKFCAILIRNQPEVPDNFNQSLFSAAIPDQRLREQFLSLTELLKKLVAKKLFFF